MKIRKTIGWVVRWRLRDGERHNYYGPDGHISTKYRYQFSSKRDAFEFAKQQFYYAPTEKDGEGHQVYRVTRKIRPDYEAKIHKLETLVEELRQTVAAREEAEEQEHIWETNSLEEVP